MTIPSFLRLFYKPPVKLVRLLIFPVDAKYRYDVDATSGRGERSIAGFADTWREAWERAKAEAERMESER